MTEEDRQIIAHSNRLVQELLDQEWLALGVSQEELDQGRLLTQQIYAELDKGKSLDEVLSELNKPRRKRRPKPSEPVHS